MGTPRTQEDTVQASDAPVSLADALFSGTRQTLLRLFFVEPDRAYTLTALIERAMAGRGAVQRETARLVDAGLITQSGPPRGRQYRANPQSPIFEELSSLAAKILGPDRPLRNALEPLSHQIHLALLYGSVARGTDHSGSDIDLLIVSDQLLLEELLTALENVEASMGRRINPTLYTQQEFNQRRADGSPFLTQVLASPYELLMGSLE